MANEEHLKILKQGVEAWNLWREKNRPRWPDLHEADLSGVNLRKADFRNADLRDTDLSFARLNTANLSGANLSGANLSGANLSGANLSRANLSRANLNDAHVTWESLKGAADLRGVVLRSRAIYLSSRDLSGRDLSGADLSGQDLSGANLSGANLSGVNLSGVNLRGAHVTWESLKGAADLRGANLSGRDLSGRDLSGRDLSGANLSGANLSGANLSGANLSGANLSGANLEMANLSRARLKGTDMEECRLRGADFLQTLFENTSLGFVTTDSNGVAKIPAELRARYENTWTVVDALPEISPEDQIRRSIEFPPEYHEAGTSILSYFATILRDKYAGIQTRVTITQEGHKVTMAIETPEGNRREIERTLQEFGLVVTGEKPVEEFLEDPVQALELKTELRLMQTRLEAKNELLVMKDQVIAHQRIDIQEFRDLIGTMAQRPQSPATIHVPVEVKVSSTHESTSTATARAESTSTFNFSAHLNPLQTHLAELGRGLPEAIRPPELDKAAVDLRSLEGETDPEEVKPRLSRVRKLLEDLGDEKSALSRAVKGTKRGVEIAQEMARFYNSIAEWCGAPQVPRVFLGKGG